MKAIKLMVVAATMLTAANANAQFVNSGSTTSKGSESGNSIIVNDCNNYGRLYADYANGKERYSFSGFSGASDAAKSANKDIKAMNGFHIGYLNGFNVTGKKLPIFVEAGLDFSMLFRSDEDSESGGSGDYKYSHSSEKKDQLMRLAIPVNLTYKLTLNNGVYIAPYAGMRFTFNLIGKETITSKSTYGGESKSDSYDINWFSDSSSNMGEDGAYNRFQFGGQVGANIGYKNLNFAIGYRWDGKIYSYSESGMKGSISTGGLRVGLGINF